MITCICFLCHEILPNVKRFSGFVRINSIEWCFRTIIKQISLEFICYIPENSGIKKMVREFKYEW